jgi:hypothetical protein
MLLVLRAGANARSALERCVELQSIRAGNSTAQASALPVGIWFGDPAVPPLPYATAASLQSPEVATVHSSIRLGDWAVLWLNDPFRIERIGRSQCRRSLLAAIALQGQVSGRFVPVFTEEEPPHAEWPRLRSEFAALMSAEVVHMNRAAAPMFLPTRPVRLPWRIDDMSRKPT